jgi:hypothetical protein
MEMFGPMLEEEKFSYLRQTKMLKKAGICIRITQYIAHQKNRFFPYFFNLTISSLTPIK